ncbi:hypothetical protein J5N97_023082 [Dioscorea zingiberensis]|uniref:Uncharacterized protein n=1 Tax=Dioscorea zingiberensis TaxID=325984 RepID=A0A9D5CCH6_9LILI|nr:hypothetical protein J5N97_023082 [Dioscorea zingiberensis]
MSAHSFLTFFPVPTSDYFTIEMYVGHDDIDKWSEYRLAGFVDSCAADFLSRLELIGMASELDLNTEGCSFWWKDIKSQSVGLTEIKNDPMQRANGSSQDDSRVTSVYVKVARGDDGSGLGVDKVHKVGEDVVVLEGTLIGESIKGKERNNPDLGGRQDGQTTTSTSQGAANNQDPINTIDPNVLEEHFNEVDRLIRMNENEGLRTDENVSLDLPSHIDKKHENEGLRTAEKVSSDLLSQIVDIPGQALPGSSTAGVGRAERSQKMPVIGGVMRRKMLSDITNTAMVAEAAGDGRNDAVDNSALLKLLCEKNKIIEMGGMEVENLRAALKKVHQQNWQLAQANSRMLAELNQGKDRLKVMQHELRCTLALLRVKTSEVEEQKKVPKHGCEKTITEEQKKVAKHVSEKTISEEQKKVANYVSEKTFSEPRKEDSFDLDAVPDTNHPASSKNVCNTNRKRSLRTKCCPSFPFKSKIFSGD